MKKMLVLFLVAATALSSCKKNNGDIPISGEASITSKLYFNNETQNYYTYGFSFSKGKAVKYEAQLTAPVDLIVLPVEEMNSGITGAQMQSPGNDHAFSRKGEFLNAMDASAYFNSLTEISDQSFMIWANPVIENEVWAIQTLDEKYAKIWIKSVEIDNEEGFVEVTFQWEFQPDGSRQFSK